MELTVHGKQMDIGDALRTHISGKIEDIKQKYFNHGTYATITLSKEGHGHQHIRTHIGIQMGKNIMINADAEAADPYVSFDSAAEKVAKQLRRYKRKLRDHHARIEEEVHTEVLQARDYIIAHTEEESEEENNESSNQDAPAIIAEMTTNVETLSVSEAVMRMDLSGQTALLFRNAGHKGINLVYRRNDGNIGWIDPELQEKKKAS